MAVICCVRLKGSLDLLCISRLNIHGNLFYMSLCWKEDFEPNPRRANSIYMISFILCIRFDSQKFSARLVCMSFLSILIALTGDSRAIVQAKYFDSFYDAQQFWKFNSSEFSTVDGNWKTLPSELFHPVCFCFFLFSTFRLANWKFNRKMLRRFLFLLLFHKNKLHM